MFPLSNTDNSNSPIFASLTSFLLSNYKFDSPEHCKAFEVPQSPLTGIILKFQPLTITDESFLYSITIPSFPNIGLTEEDLESNTFGIQLLEWRWKVKAANWHDKQATHLGSIDLICSSFRLWKEEDNLIEIDAVPPSIFTEAGISKLIIQKLSTFRDDFIKLKAASRQQARAIFQAENIELEKLACIDQDKSEKINSGLSIHELLNASSIPKKASPSSQGSKQPSHEVARERSRSKSKTSSKKSIIVLSSDDEDFPDSSYRKSRVVPNFLQNNT